LDDVLPAEAVTVLFLDGAGDKQGIVAVKAQLFDNFAGIDHGCHAAFLVAGSPAEDDLVIFISGVRIMLPVFPVSNTHGVDVGIHGNQVLSGADVPQDIAHGIDFHPVKSHGFHFLFDTLHDFFFLAAFTGNGHHVP